MALDDDAPHVGSDWQRAGELDRVLREFQREFGALSREAQIVLAHMIDGYADAVALWRLEQQGLAPVY